MRKHPAVIPPTAREKVVKRDVDGRKVQSDYFLNGKKVGYRCWDNEGKLAIEAAMRNGRMHGPFRGFHGNGAVSWTTHYVAGLEHGVSKQFDENGNVIGTYRMKHGTGVDLWFSDIGELSEERYIVNGKWNGFERWWKDGRTIWLESHFKDDLEHGNQRWWNLKGRLRRGYPKYFILGKPVSKPVYVKTGETDLSLPKFCQRDNKPNRKQPKGAMDLDDAH
jgi:hypothetical protein